MGDGELAMAITVPPVQFDHVAKAQVGDQIHNVMRHYNSWRRGPPTPRLLNDRTQRRPVQMIKMGMRDQHQVDGRKVSELHSRLAQTLQHKQPAREIGIDDDVLAAHLDEKAGVPNKRQAQISVADQFGFVSLANSWSNRGVAYQTAKRTRAFAENGIRKRWL